MAQPALFVVDRPKDEDGPNLSALNVLLAELEESGQLVGKWRALGESLKSTAQAVDDGMRCGKVTVATAQLNKMLIDGISQMPEPRRQDSGDAYDTLQAIIAGMVPEILAGSDDAPDY
ncbi:hypothetical protein RQN30_10680 [Arcanobacterium hippocoleae]